MNESLFIEYIKTIWPMLSLYINEKVQPNPRTYLHKTMLRRVYSADQKWEGSSAKTTYVAADIVAMDSPLPIKKRGTVATSNGKLPKIGMKKILRETDINNINIMRAHLSLATTDAAKTAEKQRILANLVNDAVACSVGIDEKNEGNFLAALSDGVILVPDADNTGIGLRFDYGYLDENKFSTETKYHFSREDFDRVFDKANKDGNTIITVMLAKSKLKEIRQENWAKMLVADYQGKVYNSSSILPTPSEKNFSDAFEDEFGAKITVVDRSVVYEKNGRQHSKKPWDAEHVVFLCNDEVGSLVYGTLAEATNPAAGVEYTTVDEYKLISKYSKNDPSLQEFTSGQALVVPVIEDVEQIYLLDDSNAEEVNAEAESADSEDEYITIAGKKYNKSDVATQLTALGVKADAKNSDATLIKKVNQLSDEDEATLYASLTAVV